MARFTDSSAALPGSAPVISTSRSITGSFTVDEPVISGECYTVVEVGGHRPEALADFAGDSMMTLLRNGQTRRVVRGGRRDGGVGAVPSKDPGPDGKDVRVWAITVRGDLFLAEPVPMF